MDDGRLTRPQLKCYIKTSPEVPLRSLSARSRIALLLQQGSLLAKQHRQLMSRGSAKPARGREQDRSLRSASEQRSTVDVGLDVSYVGERQDSAVIRIPAPICNLNSDINLIRNSDRGTDARSPFTRRNLSPIKRCIRPIDAGLFPAIDNSAVRLLCKPGRRSVTQRSEETPPKGSLPLRMKWLVEPLSAHLRKAQRVRLFSKAKPLAELNRRISPL